MEQSEDAYNVALVVLSSLSDFLDAHSRVITIIVGLLVAASKIIHRRVKCSKIISSQSLFINDFFYGVMIPPFCLILFHVMQGKDTVTLKGSDVDMMAMGAVVGIAFVVGELWRT
jgi:hypothetical protein